MSVYNAEVDEIAERNAFRERYYRYLHANNTLQLQWDATFHECVAPQTIESFGSNVEYCLKLQTSHLNFWREEVTPGPRGQQADVPPLPSRKEIARKLLKLLHDTFLDDRDPDPSCRPPVQSGVAYSTDFTSDSDSVDSSESNGQDTDGRDNDRSNFGVSRMLSFLLLFSLFFFPPRFSFFRLSLGFLVSKNKAEGRG